MKRILITGADSYIGTSFEKWVKQPQFAGIYEVDTLDMRGDAWKEKDFSGYDSVFHVAGIAHADVGKVTEEQKKLYYKVNCDLAVETAKKAKLEGVKQFIYMSSIIVYGEGTSLQKKRVITRQTKPSPSNFYGDSKWKAEQKLEPLGDEWFKVAILRPPMIYGEGCKGNYRILRKIALRVPVFPDMINERSALFINNLCEFIQYLIDDILGGIFFPQNTAYLVTSNVVCLIAKVHGKKVYQSKSFNWIITLLGNSPGKIGRLVNKAFGNLVYEKNMNQGIIADEAYCSYDFLESIKLTEQVKG